MVNRKFDIPDLRTISLADAHLADRQVDVELTSLFYLSHCVALELRLFRRVVAKAIFDGRTLKGE